jgi:hypothetical protein
MNGLKFDVKVERRKGVKAQRRKGGKAGRRFKV